MMTTRAATAAAAPEKLALAPLFSDQMVLQREQPLPIWGQAAPGSVVKLHLLDDQGVTITSASGEVMADGNGDWQITLPALPAAGPLQMVVTTDRQQITLKDVWLGDVWLASGQSNMEWTVAISANAEAEIAAAKYPGIRHIKVPLVASPIVMDGARAASPLAPPRVMPRARLQ